ncbi:MAG: hypothetical protein JNK15_02585 [Planctomycetes bacterium]|nr:hypothetical protein [Planctomycetota bacterium]
MPTPPRTLRCLVAIASLVAFAKAQDEPPTFRARTKAFAAWFSDQAKDAHAALTSGDKKRAEVAAKAIGARVAELVPGLRVNFERTPAGEPVTMYLQPGKDRVVQVLGRALVAALPPVEQFRFVPWRTPAAADTHLVDIGKDPVRLADLVTVCQFDAEQQGLVVHVWNEHLGRLGEADRARMARFGVERAFGAAMELRWLRAVHVLEDEPATENDGYARGADLRRTAQGLLREQKDPDLDPDLVDDTYFKSDREFPEGSRCADIAFGSSRLPDLVYDLQVGGTPETVQRLGKLGVTAGFVAMTATIAYDPFDHEAKTKVLALRKQFADDLGKALAADGVGMLVGTASGNAKGYCDVLLFDEAAARPILERVAKANDLVQAAALVSFSPTDPKVLRQLK